MVLIGHIRTFHPQVLLTLSSTKPLQNLPNLPLNAPLLLLLIPSFIFIRRYLPRLAPPHAATRYYISNPSGLMDC
jgi:hypothetical protein